MKKILLISTIVVLIIIVLPACAGSPQQLHPVWGEFIEGQLGEDAQTLNWILATDGGASKRYASFMIDPLATFDNQYKLQLRCLAKDVEASPDGLVYTLTIRNDLKWSDGTAVTAADYVYTIKNLITASWLEYSEKALWQENVGGGIYLVNPQVVNETTFKVVRKTVDPDFIYVLYELMPYPKHIAQHYENSLKDFTEAPELANMTYSGNLGPYRPVLWNTIDGFVMKRNPEYYRGKASGEPYFESYRIRSFGLQQMMNEALRDGRINYAMVEPQDANAVRSIGGFNVYTVPTGYYVYVAYNQRDNGWEGLKNPKIRQAISMVIDKPAIINDMYSGYADPAFSFIPPYSPWYNESVLKKYGMTPVVDKDKAIELIKSAGFEMKEKVFEDKDGKPNKRNVFVDKDGNPIKLNFIIDLDSEFEQNLAVLIRMNLMSIGLDINPKFSTREIIFKEGLMNKVPGSDNDPTFNSGPKAVSIQPWDLVILSTYGNALSLQGSEAFFTSAGKYNLFGLYNDKVDALYVKARSAEGISQENRKKIFNEISQILSDEQTVNFLVFYKDNVALSNKVKGVVPGPNLFYNYQTWYFD
jgi:ABC-type transport system substrate-binding protein